MDWLARNAEFLSPESITKCLIAFKDLYKAENQVERNTYVKSAHASNVVVTVVSLIENTKRLDSDEETNSRLAILLSILEALLVNDQNLDKSL